MNLLEELPSIMATSAVNEYQLAIIGGGTAGISAARFYLEVHPDAKIIVIERDNSVGGVWSNGLSTPINARIQD